MSAIDLYAAYIQERRGQALMQDAEGRASGHAGPRAGARPAGAGHTPCCRLRGALAGRQSVPQARRK